MEKCTYRCSTKKKKSDCEHSLDRLSDYEVLLLEFCVSKGPCLKGIVSKGGRDSKKIGNYCSKYL